MLKIFLNDTGQTHINCVKYSCQQLCQAETHKNLTPSNVIQMMPKM